MSQQPQTHLTDKELASRWRISTVTLSSWRVKGTGPEYVKVGKRVLYSLAVIELWELQNTKRNTAQ